MFFKERGVTVGDITVLLMVISFSFFTINKLKESKIQKQTTDFYQLEILENNSQ